MAKFCKQCGNQIPEDAMFCKACGAKVEEAPVQPECNAVNEPCKCGCEQQPQPQQQSYTQKEPNGIAKFINNFISKIKNKDTKSIAILAAIPTVLIVGLVLVLIFGGGGAESAIDDLFAATYEGDGGVAEDLAPEAFWEWVDDKYNADIEDVEKSIEKISKLTLKLHEMKLGDDISVDYDIVDEDELSNKKLDDIKDNLKARYDIPKRDVTDAIEFELEVTMEGDDDEDTSESTIIVVKIDGDWYPMSSYGRFAAEEFLSGLDFDPSDIKF